MSRSLRLGAKLVILLLLCWFPSQGAAQKNKAKQAPAKPPAAEAQAAEEPPLFTIRAGVTEVIAPVTVVGKDGSYLQNLRPTDFVLYDNGVPQQIKVQPAEIPISLVVLVGNSDRIEPLLPDVRKTGIMFTSLLLGEQGEAAVVTFDHRVEVAQDFTHNTDQIERAFQGIKTGSSQARLSDAMVQGLSMLSRRPAERRKVIVVIAEDRDNGSEMPFEYALRQAQIGGISIYSVGLSYKSAQVRAKPTPPAPGPFPPGVAAGPPAPMGGIAAEQTAGITGGSYDKLVAIVASGIKDLFVQKPLAAYAKATGSLHTGGMKKASIEAGIQQISTELHSQYLISYRPNTLSQVGFHTIKVTIDYPVSEVRVRPGYVFLGPPAGDSTPPAAPTQPK